MPVVFLANDTAEQAVRTILQYKELYNTIKAQHPEIMIEDWQVDELRAVLHINDLKQPSLNTII
jgi:dihydroorotase